MTQIIMIKYDFMQEFKKIKAMEVETFSEKGREDGRMRVV